MVCQCPPVQPFIPKTITMMRDDVVYQNETIPSHFELCNVKIVSNRGDNRVALYRKLDEEIRVTNDCVW